MGEFANVNYFFKKSEDFMDLGKLMNIRVLLESYADNKDINSHLAYWMMKFLRKTQDDCDFYQKEFNKVLAEYAEKDADGKIAVNEQQHIILKPGIAENFDAAMANLDHTSVEDPGIKFSLSDLDKLNLTIRQMLILSDFIDETK